MERNYSAKTSILATIPFFILGSMWLFSSAFFNYHRIIYDIFFYVPLFLMFVLLGIGWVKEFPRWTVPSIGFCVIFSLYLMNVSIRPLTGGSLLGFWALLPLFLTLIIGIIIKPSFSPLKQLINRIEDEKNIIFYALYGFLPILLMFLFDEAKNKLMIPFIILLTIIVSTGAFFYLFSAKKNHRSISLVISTSVSIGISIILLFISEIDLLNH